MQDPSRPATGYPAHPPYHQPNGGQAPRPGTAYPYVAPPPYPQQQYYNPDPYRNYAGRSFVRTLFATIICLGVITGVILLVSWLVIRPRLPNFQIDSLSVTNLSANSTNVSGTWHVGFLVRNKNKKMTVNYDDLQSSLYYKKEYLSEAKLPPFKQGTKSETTLNATFSALNAYVQPTTVSDLNAERASGSIGFDVQIVAATWFKSGAWSFRTRLLKVFCRNVPVHMSSNRSEGKLTGGASDCEVWT